jgi:hypothetical protein
MEEAYNKEGDVVWVKGEWVKTKTIFDKSKTNKEITKYSPSFRKIRPDNMNPVTLNIYTDIMEDIVKEYKEKRKKEAPEKKREKKRRNKRN